MKSVMEPEDKRTYSEIRFGDNAGNVPNQRSQNQSLPPMPFAFGRSQTMSQSAPHQILAPAAHQSQEQHEHTLMYDQYNHSQNMILHHHGPTIKQNNILMYPNTPGTSWDTPPISNSSNLSVSASAHYKIDQYHSNIQQMHLKAPNPMEDMVWLTQSSMQEPLDLRPNCGVEIEAQERSTLTSQEPAHHTEYMHHLGHQDPQPLSPQNLSFSSVGSNNFMYPISSSLNTTGSSSCDDPYELTRLSVRELNKRLHGLPREDMIWFKQKLRQYVQNFRKWMHQKRTLEMTNTTLQSEVHRLQMDLNKIIQERDYFKRQCELLYLTEGGSGGVHSSGQSNPGSEGLHYWQQRRDIWDTTCTTTIVKTGTSSLQSNGVSNI